MKIVKVINRGAYLSNSVSANTSGMKIIEAFVNQNVRLNNFTIPHLESVLFAKINGNKQIKAMFASINVQTISNGQQNSTNASHVLISGNFHPGTINALTDAKMANLSIDISNNFSVLILYTTMNA